MNSKDIQAARRLIAQFESRAEGRHNSNEWNRDGGRGGESYNGPNHVRFLRLPAYMAIWKAQNPTRFIQVRETFQSVEVIVEQRDEMKRVRCGVVFSVDLAMLHSCNIDILKCEFEKASSDLQRKITSPFK